MNQLSKQIDKRLNELSREIGEEEEVIGTATKHFDEMWEECFSLMGEVDKDWFLAEDGFVLSKQKRDKKPLLDEAKLYNELLKIYGKQKMRKVWANITKRVVDTTLLEKAVQDRIVDAAIIVECVTEQPPSYARVRRPWSRKDEERAVIFGVKKSE